MLIVIMMQKKYMNFIMMLSLKYILFMVMLFLTGMFLYYLF